MRLLAVSGDLNQLWPLALVRVSQELRAWHAWNNFKVKFKPFYCDYCGGKMSFGEKGLSCNNEVSGDRRKIEVCGRVSHINCREKFSHNCHKKIEGEEEIGIYGAIGAHKSVVRRMKNDQVMSQIFYEENIPDLRNVGCGHNLGCVCGDFGNPVSVTKSMGRVVKTLVEIETTSTVGDLIKF